MGISSTILGETMARNYIDLETMMLICKSSTTYKNIEFKISRFSGILSTLSKSKENDHFRSKNEERKLLNEINNSKEIRYKVEGAINTAEKKCYLLYQAAMSCIIYIKTKIFRDTN